ncbi:MAG: nucleotidyltransferase family protein [Acutalibacter sp.]|nr:nucleotidyltransferase family protein [Acutalibacter sp.]MCI8922254.1 nucleotidyltransferase family protein [Acutalibacter sp.]
MPEKNLFSAVICEFNPLHWGHLSLLAAMGRRWTGIVCILSGNFVQRGEPAILDKWTRTRLALAAGADLVIELPLPWACAGAEAFARGGAALAGSLPAVGVLAFGSEMPDAGAITQAAEALLSPEFSAALSRLPQDGSTFARRRQQALTELIGEKAALLRQPNAALGVEYCKALLEQRLPIVPAPFPRTGAGHDAPAASGETLSASQLRAMITAGEDISGLVPPCTLEAVQKEKEAGRCPASLAFLERPILSRLRAMPPAGFACLPDISEGLENRLYKASRQAVSLEGLYTLLKTKRYTHARLRRLVLSAFLGIPKDLPALPPYLHVLGMTEKGAGLLKGASLPVVARSGDVSALSPAAQALYAQEARADDLYALACPVPQPCGRLQRQGVIKA